MMLARLILANLLWVALDDPVKAFVSHRIRDVFVKTVLAGRRRFFRLIIDFDEQKNPKDDVDNGGQHVGEKGQARLTRLLFLPQRVATNTAAAPFYFMCGECSPNSGLDKALDRLIFIAPYCQRTSPPLRVGSGEVLPCDNATKVRGFLGVPVLLIEPSR
jgi:hypothetical protein